MSSAPPPFVASENFSIVTYTGNGGTQAITGVGFKPDWIWCKARSQAHDHNVTDSTRGVSKGLNPNTTAVEGNQAPLGVTAFGTDGFTVVDNSGGGASVNGNGITYVAWCWKSNGGTTSSNTDGTITSTVQANQDAGFSIVSYAGTGSAATVGHGLDSAPEMVIVKNRSSVKNWWVWHTSLGDGTKYLKLNGSDAVASVSSIWNSTVPTSTVFSVANDGGSNASGENIIAYCFKSIDGFSKIGSYTGNGSNDGPIVETGFEPAFLMIKDTSEAHSWTIHDNTRDTTNPRKKYVLPSSSNVEAADLNGINFYSNGFQLLDD